MNQPPSAGLLLKKMVLFTVLGFVTLVLLGPVVAVLSVVLSFALKLFPFVLVGFLVWTAFQLALYGRDETALRLQQLGQGLVYAFPRFGERLAAVLSFPFRVVGRIGAAVGYMVQVTAQKLWAFARWLGPVAAMALTGVAVGAAIGAAIGAQAHDPGPAIAINAALGGAIAAGTAVILSVAERRQSVRPT